MTPSRFVVFSDRAYNAMISETFRHDPIETGGFLLGYKLDNGCQIVMEVIPPGPKSTHKTAFFEYDTAFVNYLANVVNRQYQMPLQFLGLWHRHPGHMNTFSATDDETNAKLAADSPDGILSGLVNMIPDFHLTLYHTAKFRQYETVEFAVGDDLIPENYHVLRYAAAGLHPAIPAILEKCGNALSEITCDVTTLVTETFTKAEMPFPNIRKLMESDAMDLPHEPKPTVICPLSMKTELSTGLIYGKYHKATNTYNIVPPESRREEFSWDEIGYVFPECPFEDPDAVQSLPDEEATTNSFSLDALWRGENLFPRAEKPIPLAEYHEAALWHSTVPQLIVYPENGRTKFVQYPSAQECRPDWYSLQMDIFSRNKGLLESDVMAQKGAVLIGCGSVGSLFALELARAGVGRFLLVDQDILGYHNICRHQCGIRDVGKYKTDAVRERILEINPTAHIEVFHTFIQNVPLDVLNTFSDTETIYIGGADNREGDRYACQMAMDSHAAFLSVGCWERAFAGEIFYSFPDPELADYEDFLRSSNLPSVRVNANRIFYTDEQDLEKTVFEPGISTDISYVTTIAIKLALDILNRNNSDYTPRVLDYLTQFTLVCNTNRPELGGDLTGIFSHPLQVTHSIFIPRQVKDTSLQPQI